MIHRGVGPFILFLSCWAAIAGASDVWVIRGSAFSNGPLCGWRVFFGADANFYNPTASPAHIQLLDVSNGGAPLGPAGFDVAPGDVAELGTHLIESYPFSPVWVTHVHVPDGVVVDGLLAWHGLDLCKGVNPYPYYLGRVTLPVFYALTPPGSVALHPGTDLGAADVRMNVGIYNAGDLPANATIRVYRHSCGANPVVTRTLAVDARSVVQVSIAPVQQCDLRDPVGYITVVADEPSLSWVTSIDNSTLPTVTIGSSRQ
jgi:hypothetical protein